MKFRIKNMLKKGVILVISAFSFTTYAQNDAGGGVPVNECWCKQVIKKGNKIHVINLTKIAEQASYEGGECEPGGGTCPGNCEIRNSRSGRVVGEGTCTDESQGASGEVPHGPGPNDCDCIFIKRYDDRTVYINVSSEIADSSNSYRNVTECGEDCKEKTCQFERYDSEEGWVKQEGYCSGNWPTENDNRSQATTTDIQEDAMTAEPTITYYPNPTDGFITIEGPESTQTKVIDLNGKLVLETDQKQIDMSKLSSGMYIIQISSGEETIEGKIVKE